MRNLIKSLVCLWLFFVVSDVNGSLPVFHGVSFFGDTIYVAVWGDSTQNLLFSPDTGYTWENRTAYVQGMVQPMWDAEFVTGRIGWIAGIVSFIFHTSDAGQSWQLQQYGSSKFITRVKMIDSLVGWAAGGDAIYFRTTDGGQSWQWYFVGSQLFTDLYGMAPLSDQECFAAAGVPSGFPGGQGYIFHTTNGGNDWTILKHDTTYDYLDILFLDNNHGVVVGGLDDEPFSPIVLYTDNAGQTWTDVTPDFGYTLRAITSAGNNLWAVGKFGTVIHSSDGGLTWELQNTPTQVTLFDVEFSDESHGVAVGDSAVVLYTDNGGITWQRKPVLVEETENTVMSKSLPHTLYIIGKNSVRFPASLSGEWFVFSVSGNKIHRISIRDAIRNFEVLPNGYYILTQNNRSIRVLNLIH